MSNIQIEFETAINIHMENLINQPIQQISQYGFKTYVRVMIFRTTIATECV